MTVKSDSNSLKGISAATLRTIKEAEDVISIAVTKGYLDSHPECGAGSMEKVRQMCKSDLGYHLQFIYSALEEAEPLIFVGYARWLRHVFESRNIPINHPMDSLRLLQYELLKQVPEKEKVQVNSILSQGLAEFSGSAKALSFIAQPDKEKLTEFHNYSQAIIQGQSKGAEAVITNLIGQGVSYVDIGVGIVQPAMYEIGKLWQENRLTVAQEHLATAITQNAIARSLINTPYAEPNGRTILFACIEGNYHSLGLRILSDAFEIKGWESHFLGADTPTDSIIRFIADKNIDTVALSINLPGQIATLRQITEKISAEFCGKRPSILIDGLALNTLRQVPRKLEHDAWFPDAKSAIAASK